jgi:hypothetical protein
MGPITNRPAAAFPVHSRKKRPACVCDRGNDIAPEHPVRLPGTSFLYSFAIDRHFLSLLARIQIKQRVVWGGEGFKKMVKPCRSMID